MNPDKVEFDLSDYNAKRGEEPVISNKAKDNDKTDKTGDKTDKKKIRRINKKLTLQPATEALEEEAIDAQREQLEVEAQARAEAQARDEAQAQAEPEARAEAEERLEADARERAKVEKVALAVAEVAQAEPNPEEKKTRCPKGTRKNPKTGKCEEKPV